MLTNVVILLTVAVMAEWLYVAGVRKMGWRRMLAGHTDEKGCRIVTGAGIIFYPMALLACVLCGTFPHYVTLCVLMACGAVFWAMSYIDDIYSLSPVARLIVQMVMAFVTVWSALFGAPWWLIAVACVWVVGVTNGFNFMDGSMGMLCLYTATVLGGVWWFASGVPEFEAYLPIVIGLGVADVAFFIFNVLKRDAAFSGDVGSITIGFFSACLTGWLISETGDAGYLLLVAVFMVDAALTLLGRICRRKNVFESHHEHLYQRLIASGKSPMKVALSYALLQLLIDVGLAVIPESAHVVYLVAVLVALCVLYYSIGRHAVSVVVTMLILLFLSPLSTHAAQKRVSSRMTVMAEGDSSRYIDLPEVTATPKREHYTKRNNPAVDFVRRIAAAAGDSDPLNNDYYNFDRYERITLALNDVSTTNGLLRSMPELLSYLDISELSGNPILNISVKEKVSDLHFRKTPKAEKTYVTGMKSNGVDEVFDQANIQKFLEDVLREIDVYDRDINILQNRFVSPLSKIAPEFYKFYLSDTIPNMRRDRFSTDSLIVLTFVPRRSETFGFTGRFFVEATDSTIFIRRLELSVPHNINLNFISYLKVDQEYDRAPDGSRLKTRDDMAIEIDFLGQGFYVRRNTAYANHNFNAVADEVFKQPRVEEMVGATSRTDDFWREHRLIPITRAEASMADMMKTMRRNKVYYWGEKFLHIMGTGYIGTGNPNKFDIGPVNTTISGNSLEGVRLRFGGLTTAALSPRVFFAGYGAWGTRDHKWKYMGELEYSFHDKKQHPREFPVHSIALASQYDVDMLGQHYLFTNPDNFVLSLKRRKDLQIIYKMTNRLTYTLELYNNFSLTAIASAVRRESTPWMPFINGFGDVFGHYNEASVNVQLRYAPGEKFFQTRTKRFPINFDAPIFVLSHAYGPAGFAGSMFTVNRTEFSFQKRWWFSAFGFADMIVKGGHVWTRAPYPSLLIPNANLSYTIQPESFALMNAMEFINDSYAQWDLTYWANGAIFNYIPLLRKTRLREVFGFRGLWGHLSPKNRPDVDNTLFRFPAIAHTRLMSSTPYMEASAGIDNLFKCLRVDYVWRLTYRNDYDIDRWGVRVALHITF